MMREHRKSTGRVAFAPEVEARESSKYLYTQTHPSQSQRTFPSDYVDTGRDQEAQADSIRNL